MVLIRLTLLPSHLCHGRLLLTQRITLQGEWFSTALDHFPHEAHQTPRLPMLRDAFVRMKLCTKGMLAHTL
jgi:hypothetical protein